MDKKKIFNDVQNYLLENHEHHEDGFPYIDSYEFEIWFKKYLGLQEKKK